MCQLSIDQRYTFWFSKIVYVNKIDLRSAVKKFYVRGRGPVLTKIGRYTLKSLDDLLPSLKDRIFSVAYITHNNLARTVYFSMMTVYFSTLTEYFQQKTVYFLVRPYILQGPYIFKERLFYHIVISLTSTC